MPESVLNEPKVVSQPKVWTDAPIIEEYESDSDDGHVQTVKKQKTCSKSPKPDKKDCSGLLSKKLGLGYGFTKKACFVCGSFSHLIRDCDFHEKRMAKQAYVNKRKCKGTGQRENRPVWNNVNRVNHQNQFIPTVVLTSKIQVNTARASSTNNVNTVRDSSTKDVSTARHNFNSQTIPTNAARNAVGGKWEIAVKPSEGSDNCGYFYYRGIICCCCKFAVGQVLVDSKSNVIDMGFNFMSTKIYIDNESTICIVKNPVFHSKTKHIEIRHHFIRDAYEKKLIQVLKIHTDDNVADLLTKAFDVSRFNFLIVNIGMINQ
ncbi:hypothetical protein Tco_0583380 [Tanacetum coccineum]